MAHERVGLVGAEAAVLRHDRRKHVVNAVVATNNSAAAALPSARPSPDTAGNAEGRAASGNMELWVTSLNV